ncbi:MAG TPA: hypothetical protein VGJ20_33050 [Xanthobacteraceae bacterium]|jgi:hypothetical protein
MRTVKFSQSRRAGAAVAIVALAMALATAAMAQTTTFHDQAGAATNYDAAGRVTGEGSAPRFYLCRLISPPRPVTAVGTAPNLTGALRCVRQR